ncbi:DUF4058 family protein [Aphanothece sacrum]|uniref:DUF4058 domain-containing protein n=1 Tax=Aphanothece sacrum FPU1 TaxID=1920663 RepID=A0A401IKC2_APHSA|nr:DUF4058 family protein [Aphanothece sacrum]GBF81709.1 hypothetical protein AsFPU1_3129 [Aphanothece sacrum FPU1]GBF85067.1 hypothetical protein AsFPU3_2124 [Aphanothece sacrum FPU3]
MLSPFPGMNPYLEHPSLWAGIHHRLITAIADDLAPKLRPRYIVAIEERVYEVNGDTNLLVGVPDVLVQSSLSLGRSNQSDVGVALIPQPMEILLPIPEIMTEAYLEIRGVKTEEVVTIIEILSPKNKQVGIGRLQYETKRLKILGSGTHLVEIDLLRQGNSMAMVGNFGQNHYRIMVSHSETRPKAQLYGFNVRDKIPEFPVPLIASEPELMIDLNILLDEIYDHGSYDLRIDYSRPPIPPLSEPDMIWVKEILNNSEKN